MFSSFSGKGVVMVVDRRVVFHTVSALIQQTIERDTSHTWYIGLTQQPPEEQRRIHATNGDHVRRWTSFPPIEHGIAQIVALYFICNHGLTKSVEDDLDAKRATTLYVF